MRREKEDESSREGVQWGEDELWHIFSLIQNLDLSTHMVDTSAELD